MREKSRTGRREQEGVATILNRVFEVGLLKEVTFEQKQNEVTT